MLFVGNKDKKECSILDVMEFDNNNNINIQNKINDMSLLKEDDSPQQQINEQSLAQDLEKNRECK